MISLLLLLLVGLCNAHPVNDNDADKDISVGASAKEDMTTTILRMNNGSSEFLAEGDMLVPRTRNAMKCLNKAYSCLWEKSRNGLVEIPYLLSKKYDDTEKKEILGAFKDFETKTCIRFIPRAFQRAYLSIQPRYGCFSLLGRIGDKQVLSLQRFGCVSHGIIQHELLHALGFYHEQSRSDRDKYVRINWENVNEYFVNNFKRKDTDNLDTPYDYSSVMHYGRTAFGKLGSETITPIPDSSIPIGQREALSDIDILRVNKLYKCRNI